jgi:hypothetical protein
LEYTGTTENGNGYFGARKVLIGLRIILDRTDGVLLEGMAEVLRGRQENRVVVGAKA